MPVSVLCVLVSWTLPAAYGHFRALLSPSLIIQVGEVPASMSINDLLR